MTIHVATETFRDKRFTFTGIRIKPGEYAAATGNALLMTVLGSCVAVCLTDKHARVMGMNHFVLPNQAHLNPSLDLGPVGQNARYGAHAIELLINACLGLGAQKKHLQASVFGGASVLSSVSNIGASNIDFALRYLANERIAVIRTEVGGRLPRKVLFSGPTGLIEISYLNALRKIVGADSNAIAQASAVIQILQRAEMFAG